VLSQLLVLTIAAVIAFAAAFWTLRAYREAGGRRARGSLMFAGAMGLVTLGTYLVIGRPELPDAPYAARLEALKQRDPATYNGEEWIVLLAEAAKANPDDPTPHFMTGQMYLANRRPEDAARAFDAALRRDPLSAPALMGLGRALMAINQGSVSPEALAAFVQASALDDADPAPWLYQAIAAMEANDGAEARRLWGEAYRRMGEDDPRREMALRMSREAGRGD
jgi:cytochrome c-type biogenesis protein CcmH